MFRLTERMDNPLLLGLAFFRCLLQARGLVTPLEFAIEIGGNGSSLLFFSASRKALRRQVHFLRALYIFH